VVIESLAEFRPELASARPDAPQRKDEPALVVFSANSTSSLQQLADDSVGYHRRHPERLQDLAYTLARRREPLRHRSFAVLRDGVSDQPAPAIRAEAPSPKLAMVFTGQGAQWPQMALDHMIHDVDFRNDILKMDAALHRLQHPPSWSLEGNLRRPSFVPVRC
jgi:acyl transferase domain-containing protein